MSLFFFHGTTTTDNLVVPAVVVMASPFSRTPIAPFFQPLTRRQ
jgi:hypothetical protein